MTALLTIGILWIIILIQAYRLNTESRRRRDAIERAVGEWRIAIDFIAEEHAEFPHEFAAIFRSANRPAMERKFPGFFEYRAACQRDAQLEVAE